MLLKNGSKGEEVKKLQAKLGLKADGIFGKNTESAVKKWQADNKLTSDGIVGAKTWGVMFANDNFNSVQKVEISKSNNSIDLSKLKGVVSDSLIAEILNIGNKFHINTKLRLAHFLAQCSHESANFKFVSENLNYSADGLNKIFTKYFPDNLARSYAKKPEMIASRVYANRMGNDNEASGDGYKFRGRGFIQLTGKDNYSLFAQAIGEDLVNNPDLVASKFPLTSAAWFFFKNGINEIADKGDSHDVITLVTKKINGGTIGLEDRIEKFKYYHGLIS